MTEQLTGYKVAHFECEYMESTAYFSLTRLKRGNLYSSVANFSTLPFHNACW
jgi:hypothetical protein